MNMQLFSRLCYSVCDSALASTPKDVHDNFKVLLGNLGGDVDTCVDTCITIVW